MKTRFQIRNRYVMAIDLVLIVLSILGSYALRLELGPAFYFYMPSAYWMVGISLLVKPLVYYQFGLYRRLWVYASTQELKIIAVAVSVASVLVGASMLGLLSLKMFVGLPRSVIIIDWALSILAVGGARLTVRLLAESKLASANNHHMKQKQILVVGAGDAGALVVRELQKNPQMNLKPIGFLDDNQSKQHHQIHGVPVIGTLNDLSRILENQRVDEVLIAIPSAGGRIVRLIADICRLKSIPFRTMPGIYELIDGKVSVNRLRDVDITDLLRREPVHWETDELGKSIQNKTVLITGGGGSIGKELARQIARLCPVELLVLGHGENSIFESVLEISETYPALQVTPIIADMRDSTRVQNIFRSYKPHVVFHAAAHKHVPLMEMNVEDSVTNNILGTQNIVKACLEQNVEKLIMISTDKAVLPINMMGATKRIAEMIILDAAERFNKSYSVVRFGNVLGSRGSVVPIFKRQIASGGPVTITHPDMERYFMTIPEAVHLVLQAASMGKGNETFMLNMGKQVKILDLAEDLIRLSGLEPGRDIEIVFTGVRPGEKLSEDLWDTNHQYAPTGHPDISRHDCQENLHGEELEEAILHLLSLAHAGDGKGIVEYINKIVPGAMLVYSTRPDITSF